MRPATAGERSGPCPSWASSVEPNVSVSDADELEPTQSRIVIEIGIGVRFADNDVYAGEIRINDAGSQRELSQEEC
jgi:hypothetical protein